jgi:excisionase family DNA binding protein
MKLYDIQDVARILAVSPWTVRAYIRNHKIRPVRIGRLVRVDDQELEKFVAEAKAESDSKQKLSKENEASCQTR